MHLGSTAITPECAWLASAVAGAGIGSAYLWTGKTETRISLLEILAAACVVFAAQACNIPLGEISSAHFVGGVFLASCLGTLRGLWIMSLVLFLQAILLGDGSLTSLGMNICNMALIPALLVQFADRYQIRSRLAIALLSGLSVLLAALAIGLEARWGRSIHDLQMWPAFMQSLMFWHILAAAVEILATYVCLRAWNWASQQSPNLRLRTFSTAIVLACLVAMNASILSSELPDGYETAAESSLSYLLQGQAFSLLNLWPHQSFVMAIGMACIVFSSYLLNRISLIKTKTANM
jgi:cobalt/nickel transport system permease protein